MRAYEFVNESRKRSQQTRIETVSSPNIQLGKKWGGGIIKESVTKEQPSGSILKFSLQYINPEIPGGDSEGRVLGYDNSHGYPHRHYFNTIESIEHTSYQEIYDRFQTEWMDIAIKFKKGLL